MTSVSSKSSTGLPTLSGSTYEVLPSENQHVVQSGESLWEISQEHRVPLKELLAANPQIKNPNRIKAGDVINLPTKPEEKPVAELPEETGEETTKPATRPVAPRTAPPVVNAKAAALASPTPPPAPPPAAPAAATAPAPAAASGSPLDPVRQGKMELGRGQKGEAVAEMQRKLTRAGYPLTADGDFGPGTEAALKRFQTDHGIAATGRLGRTTLAALDKVAPDQPPAPADPLDAIRQGGSLRRGAKGAAVEQVQRLLTAKGYPVTVDGDFGPGTESAVKKFQASQGLPADGVVGATTLKALEATTPQSTDTTVPTLEQVRQGAILQRGAKGESVRQVQQLLTDRGFPVTVDGDYGPGTEAAVKRFQAANNIQQNGMVGPTTLAALERDPGNGVTVDQLRKICPYLSATKAAEVVPHLNRAMAEANINTPLRQAAFIAQVAHESGEFRYSEELASGQAYEGRRDLGNIYPGDGVRFKGRGYIQLTGRSNYKAAGTALGLDLINHPELAARPENAARIAAWYWTSRGLNSLADQGPSRFDDITRRINGGLNGKADRDKYYARARTVLGA